MHLFLFWTHELVLYFKFPSHLLYYNAFPFLALLLSFTHSLSLSLSLFHSLSPCCLYGVRVSVGIVLHVGPRLEEIMAGLSSCATPDTGDRSNKREAPGQMAMTNSNTLPVIWAVGAQCGEQVLLQDESQLSRKTLPICARALEAKRCEK